MSNEDTKFVRPYPLSVEALSKRRPVELYNGYYFPVCSPVPDTKPVCINKAKPLPVIDSFSPKKTYNKEPTTEKEVIAGGSRVYLVEGSLYCEESLMETKIFHMKERSGNGFSWCHNSLNCRFGKKCLFAHYKKPSKQTVNDQQGDS